MQKNVPKYTPDWVRTVTLWAETSKRDVSYALCNDRRTLLWFANQRAVEYHPALCAGRSTGSRHRISCSTSTRPRARRSRGRRGSRTSSVRRWPSRARRRGQDERRQGSAHLRADRRGRLDGGSGRGHPRDRRRGPSGSIPTIATTAFIKEDRDGKVFVDSTRAGGATVVAAYSPRIRPGVPVSFPVAWDDLDAVAPGDFTLQTAFGHLAGRDPWREQMPAPQRLPAELVEEAPRDPASPACRRCTKANAVPAPVTANPEPGA